MTDNRERIDSNDATWSSIYQDDDLEQGTNPAPRRISVMDTVRTRSVGKLEK